MRISNAEAEQRAVALAENFLQRQESRGWSYRYNSASPNLFAADNKHRKTFIKWSVFFDIRPLVDDSIMDGGVIIYVNIMTEEVWLWNVDNE